MAVVNINCQCLCEFTPLMRLTIVTNHWQGKDVDWLIGRHWCNSLIISLCDWQSFIQFLARQAHPSTPSEFASIAERSFILLINALSRMSKVISLHSPDGESVPVKFTRVIIGYLPVSPGFTCLPRYLSFLPIKAGHQHHTTNGANAYTNVHVAYRDNFIEFLI